MVSARQPSSPVSLPVSQSLSLQLTGPDASSLSVSSHRTSLVSPTRSVTVQTSVVTGQTSVVIGQTSTVTGQTSIITSQTSAVTVQTSVVTGQTSTVSGQTNTVTVQTSAVTGQSNTVTGQTSTVNGQTSTVSGQTSTVAVQTSIVAGQTSIVSGQSSTVTDQANTVSGQTSTIDVSPTRTSPGISASVPTGKLISHFFFTCHAICLLHNAFLHRFLRTRILQIAWFCSSLISTLLCDHHISKLFWEHNSFIIFFYFLASLVFCLCFLCLVRRPLILLWRFFIMLKFYADVNPCKRNNGGCAHYCTRLNREYNCSCSSGFKLNADRHTCTGINDLEIHIIKTG